MTVNLYIRRAISACECKNGGMCEEDSGSFTCHCAKGYYGQRCETDGYVSVIRCMYMCMCVCVYVCMCVYVHAWCVRARAPVCGCGCVRMRFPPNLIAML